MRAPYRAPANGARGNAKPLLVGKNRISAVIYLPTPLVEESYACGPMYALSLCEKSAIKTAGLDLSEANQVAKKT